MRLIEHVTRPYRNPGSLNRNSTSCSEKNLSGSISKVKYVSENRKKKGARLLANLAQEYGFLVPKPCERCGAQSQHKHHEDYDKPLDIVWLCVRCHVGLHVGERDAETEGVIGVLQRFLAEP